LNQAIGFDLGPSRRRSIAHLLDYPYGALRGWEPEPEKRRGPKVNRRVDIIISRVAIIIASEGGSWPDVFPLKNKYKTKKELLEIFNEPGFPRFLLFIRDELPRTSQCRRASEFQFLRAANLVLRRERPARPSNFPTRGTN
jgi:hypothetical protein